MAATELTKADFQSDQETRWCPGCGDYAVLAAVQGFFPELGIPPERVVFVSGIGCAGRFAYYMDTYGMHGIHGRGPALATGSGGRARGPLDLGRDRRRRRVEHRRQPPDPRAAAQRPGEDPAVQQPDLRADQGPGVADLRAGEGDQVDAVRVDRRAVQPGRRWRWAPRRRSWRARSTPTSTTCRPCCARRRRTTARRWSRSTRTARSSTTARSTRCATRRRARSTGSTSSTASRSAASTRGARRRRCAIGGDGEPVRPRRAPRRPVVRVRALAAVVLAGRADADRDLPRRLAARLGAGPDARAGARPGGGGRRDAGRRAQRRGHVDGLLARAQRQVLHLPRRTSCPRGWRRWTSISRRRSRPRCGRRSTTTTRAISARATTGCWRRSRTSPRGGWAGRSTWRRSSRAPT